MENQEYFVKSVGTMKLLPRSVGLLWWRPLAVLAVTNTHLAGGGRRQVHRWAAPKGRR